MDNDMSYKAELDSLRGGVVVGLSFPTPGTFKMKCLKFVEELQRTLVEFDLVFLQVETVRIFNDSSLADSTILAVNQDLKGEEFRFDFGEGTISVKCESMEMLSYSC